MTNLFKGIGKLIGALLAIVFVIVALASMFTITIERQALSSEFYLDLFESQDIYDRLPQIAAEQLSFSMTGEAAGLPASSGGPPGYFQVLSVSDWELLLTGLLPSDWLEGQVRSVLGQVFEYLDTGGGDFSVIFSLEELKENLSGEEGIRSIQQLLEAQPECSNEALVDMTMILQGDENPGIDFLGCSPPADFFEENTGQFEVMLRRSLNDVPDETDLAAGLFSDQSEVGVSSLFGYQVTSFLLIKWIRWLIQMSPLFSVFILLGVAFFAVESFQSLRGWWGIPLLITGGIAIVIALVATPLANWLVETLIARVGLSGLSPNLVETGLDLFRQLIGSLFGRLLIMALIVLGLGLGIAIVPGFFKSRRSEGDAPPPESDPAPPMAGDPIPSTVDEPAPREEDDPTPPTPGDETEVTGS